MVNISPDFTDFRNEFLLQCSENHPLETCEIYSPFAGRGVWVRIAELPVGAGEVGYDSWAVSWVWWVLGVTVAVLIVGSWARSRDVLVFDAAVI